MENTVLKNGEHFLKVNGIQHWVKIKGAELRTVPIVVIHGGPGGNHYTFERTIGPLLEPFTTIIYYEQRGCGRTEPPDDRTAYSRQLLLDDLEELRKSLRLPVFIPLGYSFGGELALEYTLAYPHSVEKLIVQAPSIDDHARMDQLKLDSFLHVSTGKMKEKIEQINSKNLSTTEKLQEIWEIVDTETVDRLLFENQDFAQLNRRLWEESGLTNRGDLARCILRQKNSTPLLKRVHHIYQETLVLVGQHDRNTGVSISKEVAKRIPHSSLYIFQKSAHFPDIEESEHYAKIVHKFLRLKK